jgi:hypothetical protein
METTSKILEKKGEKDDIGTSPTTDIITAICCVHLSQDLYLISTLWYLQIGPEVEKIR